jgi:hypothetical protein
MAPPTEIPYLRCPLCGSLRRVRDIVDDIGQGKALEIMTHRITSFGRGQIQNEWTASAIDEAFADTEDVEELLERLIRNAEDTTQYLKAEWERCTGEEWVDEGEEESEEDEAGEEE